jgi:phosphatidylglycerophosphatase A
MTKLSNQTIAHRVWRDPLFFLAFGFGSGLMPKAPGTWGTLAAVPIVFLMAKTPWYAYLSITLMAFLGGIILCERVSRELGMNDYPGIVWDEIVGYSITMFLAPTGLVWMFIGFLLFRLFDIWKPQPIGFVDQHVHGGLGIMLDDVLAAIPAWAILQLIARCI